MEAEFGGGLLIGGNTMKRIVPILLVILLGTVGVCASAETPSIDISAMETSALMELYEQIHTELNARINASNIIGSGTYDAGTDIASGRYRFTCTVKGSKDDLAGTIEIAKWDAEQEKYDFWNGEYYGIRNPGEVVIFTIQAGERLRITNLTGTIEPYGMVTQ